MLPIQFPENTSNMRYEYHRVREGPNYFVSYYKHSSRLHYDPKEAWRTLGVAKFTDTGKALKEWAINLHEEYVTKINGAEGYASDEPLRADTSFASEVQSENEEPNDNTRTVV